MDYTPGPVPEPPPAVVSYAPGVPWDARRITPAAVTDAGSLPAAPVETKRAPAAAGVSPSPMPEPPDTPRSRYERLMNDVTRGWPVVMGVGVKTPSEYVSRYDFPSGFLGIPDGVYDCYLEGGWKPVMKLRPAPGVAAPSPFAGWPAYPTTPAIPAPQAAGPPSTASPGTTPTAVVIPTNVRGAARFGGTVSGCST